MPDDPARTRGAEASDQREVAVLGGGCFWCLEAAFQDLEGVWDVTSGYSGGTDPAPTYRAVCAGGTGHAEVVHITFDPRVLPYDTLLEVFFAIHDPTTPNRQGADVGTQYRSIILFTSEAQRRTAEETIRSLSDAGRWPDPIVTEVVPLDRFHPAEAEHDDYYRRNPDQPYCSLVIAPKLAKARKSFQDLYRS